MKTQRRKGTMKMAAEGAQKLLEVPFIIILRLYAIILKFCLYHSGLRGYLWNSRQVSFSCYVTVRSGYNEIIIDAVDLSAWRSKITEEMALKGDDEEVEIGELIQQVCAI